jgi:capsular polysaccharide biosynthesis protein
MRDLHLSTHFGEAPRRATLAPMKRDISWATAITLIAALLVMAYGLHQPLKYEARAKVLVGQKQDPSDCHNKICLIPNAPAKGFDAYTSTVARTIPTTPMAQEVAQRLNLPKGNVSRVVENTNAEADTGTAFIDVTYTDGSPKRAQQITNTLAKVSSERISETSLGAHRITATLWQPAALPGAPVSPNPLRNGLITLAIGLALSLVVIAIREYLRGNYQR